MPARMLSSIVGRGCFVGAPVGPWIVLAAALAASCAAGEGSEATGNAGTSGPSGGAGGGTAGSSKGGAGGNAGAAGLASAGTTGSGVAGSSATGGGGLAGAAETSGSGGAGAVAGGGTGGAGRGGAGTAGAAGGGGLPSGGSTGNGGRAGGAGAGATAGVGGRGGTGGAVGGAGGTASGPFVCNQVTGGKLTYEWFAAGFENVVDNKRWQAKWREDAYVEEWADPQSSFWTAQISSACANNTATPDRVVFGTVSFKYKTQTEWRQGITQAVNTIKAKYPGLKRMDLVTQIRGPNNMLCPTAPTAGETIAVPPEQDAAMGEVAAAFPGFVFVGPRVQAHSCSEFVGGGPHLTTAGNMANVQPFADYFVQAQ